MSSNRKLGWALSLEMPPDLRCPLLVAAIDTQFVENAPPPPPPAPASLALPLSPHMGDDGKSSPPL
jgi:hypothetical protein